jgi:hypothetical protein
MDTKKTLKDIIDIEKLHQHQWTSYLAAGYEFYEVLDEWKVIACKTPPLNDLHLGRATKIKYYSQFKTALDEAAEKGILNSFLRPDFEQAFQSFLFIYLNADESRQKELLPFFKELTGQRVSSLLFPFLDAIKNNIGEQACLEIVLQFSQEDLSLVYVNKNAELVYSHLPEKLYQFYNAHGYTEDQIHSVMVKLIKQNRNYLNKLEIDSHIYSFLKNNFEKKHWEDYIDYFDTAKILLNQPVLDNSLKISPVKGFSISYNLVDIIDYLMLPGMPETFYKTLVEAFHQALTKVYPVDINKSLSQSQKKEMGKTIDRIIFFEYRDDTSFTEKNYRAISFRFFTCMKTLDLINLGTSFNDTYINNWLLKDKLEHELPANADVDTVLIKI